MSDQPASSGQPEQPIYDLAPVDAAAAPLPKGTVVERASKVGDKSLIDDFDEDADFSKDPEVERTLKGAPAVAESAPAVPVGPPFVKPGLGDVQQVAIAAGVVLLGAIIAAAVTAQSRSRIWYADAILTAYAALLHAATGAAAVMMGAYLQSMRVGDLLLAAARMGLAVAVFQLIFHLNIPIAGRADEVLLACAAYVGVVWALFRWSREHLTMVISVHAMLWTAIYAAAVLWYWAQKTTGA